MYIANQTLIALLHKGGHSLLCLINRQDLFRLQGCGLGYLLELFSFDFAHVRKEDDEQDLHSVLSSARIMTLG